MSEMCLDRVWLVECERCANEGISYEYRREDAVSDLTRQGWAEGFCPACNGVTR